MRIAIKCSIANRISLFRKGLPESPGRGERRYSDINQSVLSAQKRKRIIQS